MKYDIPVCIFCIGSLKILRAPHSHTARRFGQKNTPRRKLQAYHGTAAVLCRSFMPRRNSDRSPNNKKMLAPIRDRVSGDAMRNRFVGKCLSCNFSHRCRRAVHQNCTKKDRRFSPVFFCMELLAGLVRSGSFMPRRNSDRSPYNKKNVSAYPRSRQRRRDAKSVCR